MLALGSDLERAWSSPGATPATRKRIIRTLINEIVVCVSDQALDLVVHWHGGDHTALEVKKNRTGQHRWSAAADVVDLVRSLARQMPDKYIAAVLNRAGKSICRGNSWTRGRVNSLRNQQTIEPYREGERSERGEVTLDEAAAVLQVSASTVRRLIEDGTIPADRPMPTETAISRSLAPSACFSLRTSRSFRIGALSAGIGPPLAWPQRTVVRRFGRRQRERFDHPQQGGRLTSESVAGFPRNTQPSSVPPPCTSSARSHRPDTAPSAPTVALIATDRNSGGRAASQMSAGTIGGMQKGPANLGERSSFRPRPQSVRCRPATPNSPIPSSRLDQARTLTRNWLP